VIVAPLGSIGAAAADAPTPALVVIGQVVAIREALAVAVQTARSSDLRFVRRRSRASVAYVCGFAPSRPGAFPDAPRASE
jgi:hypothetical protein